MNPDFSLTFFSYLFPNRIFLFKIKKKKPTKLVGAKSKGPGDAAADRYPQFFFFLDVTACCEFLYAFLMSINEVSALISRRDYYLR